MMDLTVLTTYFKIGACIALIFTILCMLILELGDDSTKKVLRLDNGNVFITIFIAALINIMVWPAIVFVISIAMLRRILRSLS